MKINPKILGLLALFNNYYINSVQSFLVKIIYFLKRIVLMLTHYKKIKNTHGISLKIYMTQFSFFLFVETGSLKIKKSNAPDSTGKTSVGSLCSAKPNSSDKRSTSPTRLTYPIFNTFGAHRTFRGITWL